MNAPTHTLDTYKRNVNNHQACRLKRDARRADWFDQHSLGPTKPLLYCTIILARIAVANNMENPTRDVDQP